MKSFMLTTTIFVALLCFVSLPIIAVESPKKPWPKQSELAAGHHHHKGSGRLEDSKVGQAIPSISDSSAPLSPPGLRPGFPNIPGLPNIPEIPIIPGLPSIPEIPNIPMIPNIPQLPNIPSLPNLPGLPSLPGLPRLPELPPLPPFKSEVVSQSAEVEKCLTKDGSKTSEKCFSQMLSSWAKKNYSLDKECCMIVVNMDKKCYSHVHKLFKNPFLVPLLRYSCHIKHTKN